MGYTPWVQRVGHNLVTEQQQRNAKGKNGKRGEGKAERERKEKGMNKGNRKEGENRKIKNVEGGGGKKICCI